jgi:hypothetical protein
MLPPRETRAAVRQSPMRRVIGDGGPDAPDTRWDASGHFKSIS